MRLRWLICLIAISIAIFSPLAYSQCPNCCSGIWNTTRTASANFNDPGTPNLVDDTLILQQEGSRISGTFGGGASIDGSLSGPYDPLPDFAEQFCELSGDFSVPAGDGKRNYGKFIVRISTDCHDLGGYFTINGEDVQVWGSRTGNAPPASYQLDISANPDKANHPLGTTISLKENGKPLPNAKLNIHAFNLSGNDVKLADYFTVSSCANCLWTTKGEKKVGTICQGYEAPSAATGGSLFKPSCPLRNKSLEVLTDANGIATLEFFLNLPRLGDQAPQRDKPLSIPVKVEYWIKDANGGDEKVASNEKKLKLDSIGVVESITYEAPPRLDPLTGDIKLDSITGKPKVSSGDLANYIDDQGTNSGQKGSDRVRMIRSAKGIGPSEERPLRPGDVLYVGDKIEINAENMRTITGRQVVMPGYIWVQMKFYDGFVGKVGVSGDVPTHTVEIGRNPYKTGFASWTNYFTYWDQSNIEAKVKSEAKSKLIKTGLKYGISEYAPPIVKGVGKFIRAITWLYEAKPVYIEVESAILVDYNEDGEMQVTTREGKATIFTEATGDDGFEVPAGKTAVIPPDLKPILKDTDAKTGQDADELLAGLEDPFAASAPAGSGETTSTSGGVPSTNGASPGPGAAGGAGNATAGNATGGGAPGSPTAPGVSGAGVATGGGATGGVLSPSGNNQIGDSAPLASGQSISQTINPAGASNFYSFHVDSPGILELRLEDVPKDMRPFVSLHDKNLGSIAERAASNAGDTVRLEKDVSGPGWLYIEVRDLDGKAYSEPYSLKVSFRAAPDEYEPNPNLFRATLVQPDQTLTAYLCPVNDEDYFKIHVDTPGILKLKLDTVPEDMKSELSLRDKTSTQIAYATASNPGDKVSLEKDLQGAGWYYIEVRDPEGKAFSDPYTLKISFQPAPDQFEPNPNFFRATELTPGQSVTAYICPSNDEDFYRFQGSTGVVKIALDSVPAEMKSEVSLYDKTWTQIAYSSASNPGDKVRLEKEVQGPGWYYIKVRDPTGKAFSEPYTLTATL
jgi:hypothetical protein